MFTVQLTAVRSRPGRRRGAADSDSEDGRSVVSSSDSDSELHRSDSEPPTKKKYEVMQHNV